MTGRPFAARRAHPMSATQSTRHAASGARGSTGRTRSPAGPATRSSSRSTVPPTSGRSSRRSPRATIRNVDASAALALPGVLAVLTPDNAPRLTADDPELALFQSPGGRLPGPARRRRGGNEPGDRQGRRRPGADRLRRGAARRHADARSSRALQAGQREPELPDRHRARRPRRRVRRRPGARRPDVPDARRAQQPDGAARHDRLVGRRPADGVRRQRRGRRGPRR